MDYGTLSSIMTVVSLMTFIGIVLWAYSGRRKAAFERAAMEPFALPDEGAAGDLDQAQSRGRP